MEQNIIHLEVFKKHFKKGWIKSNTKHGDYTEEQVEEKFSEEWEELLNEEEGKEMLIMLTACMDEYHYEISQKGDAEQQIYSLGGQLVTAFMAKDKAERENKELKHKIEHLQKLLEIAQTRRKSSGLQVGSYKYRSSRK